MKRKIKFNDIIKFIEESDDINSLPVIDTIFKRIGGNKRDYDYLFEYWNDTEIVIKDGTKVKLILEECLNTEYNNEHFNFYYIKVLDIYICAECLLRLKYHSDIYEEFKVDEKYVQPFLLPVDWTYREVRKYIRSNINENKELEGLITTGEFKYEISITSYCSKCVLEDFS